MPRHRRWVRCRGIRPDAGAFWEIGAISGLSERAINKIIADAMIKLDAVTRTQAVVNAIRLGKIEF